MIGLVQFIGGKHGRNNVQLRKFCQRRVCGYFILLVLVLVLENRGRIENEDEDKAMPPHHAAQHPSSPHNCEPR